MRISEGILSILFVATFVAAPGCVDQGMDEPTVSDGRPSELLVGHWANAENPESQMWFAKPINRWGDLCLLVAGVEVRKTYEVKSEIGENTVVINAGSDDMAITFAANRTELSYDARDESQTFLRIGDDTTC